MDPEIKHLLVELLSIEKDNHRLLKAVHRHQLFAAFWRIFVWIFVIVATGYSYFAYLKPIMDKFVVPGSPSPASFFNLSSPELQKLIDSYKAAK